MLDAASIEAFEAETIEKTAPATMSDLPSGPRKPAATSPIAVSPSCAMTSAGTVEFTIAMITSAYRTVTVTMLAAIARGTVLRGSIISPALAAMAENPKNVMNASAAVVSIPTTSVEKPAVKFPIAVVGPRYAKAPAMNAKRTATFAPETRSWNVPDSSVPRALRTPRRTAAATPVVPCGSQPSDSGIMKRKNHSSIVAR